MLDCSFICIPFPAHFCYYACLLRVSAVRALAITSSAPGTPSDKAEEAAASARDLATQLRTHYKSHCSHAEVARALASADVAGSGGALRAQLAPLAAAAEAAPRDPSPLFALAEAQFGAGLHGEAIDSCLAVIKLGGPAWREGAAKAMLLKVFEVLGNGSPLVVAGRRQLGKLLFR